MEKNKNPAELQISAEQILLEAYESRDVATSKTRVKIADLEELHEFQRRQRQGYEDALRRNRLDYGQWARYAMFEVDQKDMNRARSIFERALEVNSHYVPIWIKYIDSELKNRNINHARNLFDRVTTILPRVDKFWFKYVQTEEFLQNISTVRKIFERWINWEPSSIVWDQYVNFEKRYEEFDNVRKIYNKYILIHPEIETWLKWIKFEKEFGNLNSIREVYTIGIDKLGLKSEELIVSFASWEALQNEFERSRSIFRFGLIKFPNSVKINNELINFEKKYGNKDGIEDSIIIKRKQNYELDLQKDPSDYDTWWSYLNLLDQDKSSIEFKRQAYEDSIKNVPNSKTKDISWKKYIYLWIKYLIFEEFNNEFEKVSSLFKKLINETLPKTFTFSKIWILYSNFQIRQGNLASSRKLLGMSIGKFPKTKTFNYYINLEIKLKEFDRVRKIYNKFVESFPNNVEIWLNYANFEYQLNDIDRSRSIYKLALNNLNNNELIFNSYIEFEKNERNFTEIRKLFEDRLVNENKNVRLWINFALFELSIPSEEQLKEFDNLQDDSIEFEFDINEKSIINSRNIYNKGLKNFKLLKDTESRLILFESFKNFEQIHGNETTQAELNKRFPIVVKKIKEEDGIKNEYFDYIFPDDEKMSKFLSNAKKWAKEKK